MSEISAALKELEGVAREMHNLNKQMKELRQRKKDLDSIVIEYLDSNDIGLLLHTRSMFDVNTHINDININCVFDNMKRRDIITILKNDGFIFPDILISAR